MSDPVSDYFDSREKIAQDKYAEDIQLFNQWKENPNKPNLGKLLKHFEPEINKRVKLFKAPAVDIAAFKADLKKNAIVAFETFDPNRGASLRTHVANRLKRSQRFNAKHQNVAFIPEEKSALITPIQKARDFLYQENGTEPSHSEISTYLNDNPGLVRNKRVSGQVTPQLVKTVYDYQIADIAGSSFESDPYSKTMSSEVETMGLLRGALKPDEQVVYDYLLGKNGKPKIESTGVLATRLGKSPSQISRLRKRIEATFRKYT